MKGSKKLWLLEFTQKLYAKFKNRNHSDHKFLFFIN